jgi:ferrous iron transport protein B
LSSHTNNQIKIALVGNPNAGKSSLFNALTGLNQKTGNYSGVTVDKFEGHAYFDVNELEYKLSIIDLPGIYSLSPNTIDEEVACRTLLNEAENIDVTVVVLDASNLKRSLLIATQIIDLKYKTVVVLNMMDEADKQHVMIDLQGLQKTLGVEVVAIDSKHRVGIDILKKAIVNAKQSSSYFYDISLKDKFQAFNYKQHILKNLKSNTKENSDFTSKDQLYRYNTINYLIAKFVKSPKKLLLQDISSSIDKFVTHKIFGYLILLGVLFLVFQFIFFVAEYPMSWIESAFLNLQNLVATGLPKGQLNNLLVNGVLAGIGGVIMFVPQIALLFLFIGFLEDSGYMARASFIMDKLMRKFGLNGKSVIPLISGTACAVPSIMATRSISNYKERLITVFILPLISCSARLPVYTLIISLIYPSNSFFGIFNTKGLVLMVMYLLGFAVTLITAFFLNKLIKSKEASFFVMEMPVYRLPQAKNIGIMVFNKVKIFVLDAGKIILAISIVLWFLSSNGPGEKFEAVNSQIEQLENSNNDSINASVLKHLKTKQMEHSYVGLLGKAIEPIIKPMGFDWKIGIALITSFAAREVFVGTMATIYGAQEQESGIKQKLALEKDENGKPKYSAAVCWSLLLFYAFALQCMSTIAVVKRETKSWKWTLVQFVFMTSLAYLSAFAAYSLLS